MPGCLSSLMSLLDSDFISATRYPKPTQGVTLTSSKYVE